MDWLCCTGCVVELYSSRWGFPGVLLGVLPFFGRLGGVPGAGRAVGVFVRVVGVCQMNRVTGTLPADPPCRHAWVRVDHPLGRVCVAELCCHEVLGGVRRGRRVLCARATCVVPKACFVSA